MVLMVLVVVAVSVVTATPLKLNPLFRHPDSFLGSQIGGCRSQKVHVEMGAQCAMSTRAHPGHEHSLTV